MVSVYEREQFLPCIFVEPNLNPMSSLSSVWEKPHGPEAVFSGHFIYYHRLSIKEHMGKSHMEQNDKHIWMSPFLYIAFDMWTTVAG